jgi:hypothetical protein
MNIYEFVIATESPVIFKIQIQAANLEIARQSLAFFFSEYKASDFIPFEDWKGTDFF